MTLSYGGESAQAVMARADAPLCSAKGSGRDRAVWHATTIVDLIGTPVADRA